MAAPSLGRDASRSFVVGGNKIAAGKPLPQNLIYDLNDFYGFYDFYSFYEFYGLSFTAYPLSNLPQKNSSN